MAGPDTLLFEHKGIGAVLAQNRFVVPLNQREYSWEEEHVSELFSDLSDAILKAKSAYFLGTIVLTRPEHGDVPEVSDGQQRLATTTILLSAIRDYFFESSDRKRSSHMEQVYLRTTDLASAEEVPRLILNTDDKDFFRRHVIASPDSRDRKAQPTKASHKRIANAASLAREHVHNVVSTLSESAKTTRLSEWVKFLENGAQVIVLRVPDHLNAFIMFETLNDRGLKASQADLLKNHLLGFCGDTIHEGQQKWSRMLGMLESTGRKDDFTVTYLHHLLIVRYGPTKEREVFDKIKSTVNSQSRAMELLEDLDESAVHYAALFNSDHRKWNEYGTSTRRNLSTLNTILRVVQIRPLMFAVSRFFRVPEAKAAYRMMVNWAVRLLIFGTRGGVLDRAYALRALEISTGKITTAQQLRAALVEVLPSDPLFEAAFAEARVSQERLARYYLRMLELTRKGVLDPEYVPSDEESSINLEHILPDNPAANWRVFNPEAAQAAYNRIGNLCIIQAKKNSLIGNSSFEDKRAVLKSSTFLLTSEVANYATWTLMDIDARQAILARLAVSTWPL